MGRRSPQQQLTEDHDAALMAIPAIRSNQSRALGELHAPTELEFQHYRHEN